MAQARVRGELVTHSHRCMGGKVMKGKAGGENGERIRGYSNGGFLHRSGAGYEVRVLGLTRGLEPVD
jgi:hypothetical protein